MNAIAGAKLTERRQMDWLLVGSAGLLLIIGLLALYSATGGGSEFKKQLVWLLVGLPFAYLMYRVDARIWAMYSRLLYTISAIILLLTKFSFFGKSINGAERWFSIGTLMFQPSEPAKLIFIITYADLIARWKQDFRTLKGFVVSVLFVGVPFLLVLIQPDLGTSMVFLALWLGMSLVARQRLSLLGLVLPLGAIALWGAWSFGILRDYQVARWTQFWNGKSYQIEIAILSIGSGQSLGQGYNKGQLKQSGLVPVQKSDFIFTVIAEETGFIGSALTILTFAFFLWRVWLVVLGAAVPLLRCMAAGIFIVFAFHTLVNLLMVVGMFPVVGVPLPFCSYGGSKMVLL